MLSITHPAFNNASTVRVLEEEDDEGEIKTVYSVKTSRYMTHSHAKGVALRSQPKPQTSPLGWGGKFSEIPPVLVARFRKI